MMTLFAWAPGYMEMIIVAGVALLLFGHRLPSVMRSLGTGIVEFKKGMNGEGMDETSESSGNVEKKV